MQTLYLRTPEGKVKCQVPTGWDEITYADFTERIAPHLKDDPTPADNLALLSSLTGVEIAPTTDMATIAPAFSILLSWMQEAPEPYGDEHVSQPRTFTVKGETFTIPVLGVRPAPRPWWAFWRKRTTHPYITAADWETVDDAMRTMGEQTDAEVGVRALAALARNGTPVTDQEYVRRMELFRDVDMDVIRHAAFFLLTCLSTFGRSSLPCFSELARLTMTSRRSTTDGRPSFTL